MHDSHTRLFLAALAACSALLFSTSAASAQEVPGPEAVCKHIGTVEPMGEDAAAECQEAMEALEKELGEANWSRFATCAIAAQTEEAFGACMTEATLPSGGGEVAAEEGAGRGAGASSSWAGLDADASAICRHIAKQEGADLPEDQLPECETAMKEIGRLVGEESFGTFKNCAMKATEEDEFGSCMQEALQAVIESQNP